MRAQCLHTFIKVSYIIRLVQAIVFFAQIKFFSLITNLPVVCYNTMHGCSLEKKMAKNITSSY